MEPLHYTIENAVPSDFEAIGQLLTEVYAQLDGFPKPADQPGYYLMLANVQQWTTKPEVEILVAKTTNGRILGAVIYFGDMQHYGSGGTATSEINSAGFRLLAVDRAARGMGIGKLLVEACIGKAIATNRSQVILHTTQAVKVAWKLYEARGFVRSPDLDFRQQQLEVYGFRLELNMAKTILEDRKALTQF